MTTKFWNLKALAGTVVVAVVATVAGPVDAAEPLVSAEWLKTNSSDVVLLDVEKSEKMFKAGHIPGATFVPWKQVRGKGKENGTDLIKMLPSKVSFTRLMRVSGVDNDSHVVVTSSGVNSSDMFLATRLYWQLKYFGHDDVSVLNGGNAAWQEAGMSLRKGDAPKPEPGNFSVRDERKEILVTTQQAQDLVSKGADSFVDARTLDYHIGLEQKDYVYAKGHIPGSRLLPNYLLVTHGKAAKFRDAEDIKAAMNRLDVPADGDVVAYCNSGHLGSGLWFALHEIAGNSKARLYDGSMHAWTKDDSRPVTVQPTR